LPPSSIARPGHTIFERDTLAIVLREPSVGGILIGKHFQMVGMTDPAAAAWDIANRCPP
jgi:hypothetical protein